MSIKRRVLIFGGNSGLGRHAVEKLVGHDEIELTVTFRTAPKSVSSSPQVRTEICDNSNYFDLEKLLNSESNLKKWDLIVDYTGLFFAKSLIKSNQHDISTTIFTNLISPAWVVKLALEGLNDNGQLILFSSVVGINGGFGSSAYSASKLGLEALVKAASTEYAPRGLSISCLRLSYFDAGMTEKLRINSSHSSKNNFWDDIQVKDPELLSRLILQYALGEKRTVNGQITEF